MISFIKSKLKNRKIWFFLILIIFLLLPHLAQAGWLSTTVGIINGLADITGFFVRLILRIFGVILLITTSLLNLVIQLTVVNMKAYVDKIGTIDTAWKMFRDVANLTFIFILLYISIATILRLESVNTKKVLTHIVIVALLINFSLFFTKIIIDTSNLLSIQFYNLIDTSGESTTGIVENLFGGTNGPVAGVLDNGISNAFLRAMDITTIYPTGSLGKNPMSVLFAGILGAVFILLAACIFLVVGVIFICRFIVLIFLMITSPLAYAAMILPATSGMSKKWWNSLMKECLFAPIFFLLVWATIKMMSNGALKVNINNGQGFGYLFSGHIEAVGVVINFMLVGGMLVGSLIIGRQMGVSGANTAFGWFDGIRRAAQGFVGRNTLGEFGRFAEERIQSSRFAKLANQPFFDAIRRGTTGALAGAKFGSKTSRVESYMHGQELADTRLAAEYAKKARASQNKLKDIKDTDSEDYKKTFSDYKENLAKLTPQEMEKVFSRAELKGDALLLNAMTSAQRNYITGEGSKKLSGEEKDKAGEVWARSIETEANQIEGLKTDVRTQIAKEIAAGADIKDEEKEYEKRLNDSKQYNTFRKNLRGFSIKDAELMYRTAPELFTNKDIAQYFSADLVDKVKKEEWIGKDGKDKLREAKFHGIYSATDEAEAAYAEYLKAQDEFDKTGDTAAYDRAMAAHDKVTVAEKKIKKELQGRNAKELLMLDFKHRNSRFVQQHFGVQEAKTMNSQNRDDVEKLNVANNILEAYVRGEMTETQAQLLKYWMEGKDREALAFFSAAARQGVDLPPELQSGNWKDVEVRVQGMVKLNKDRV